MQWHREEWIKDSGWIQRNGDWKSEGASDVNFPLLTRRRKDYEEIIELYHKQESCEVLR
jgi:hypothetical protein